MEKQIYIFQMYETLAKAKHLKRKLKRFVI